MPVPGVTPREENSEKKRKRPSLAIDRACTGKSSTTEDIPGAVSSVSLAAARTYLCQGSSRLPPAGQPPRGGLVSTQLLADIFGPDLIIIVVVVVIVMFFGGSKLPQLARGLGSAASEFRKGVSEGADSPEERSGEVPREPSTATEPANTAEDPPTGENAPAGGDDPKADR